MHRAGMIQKLSSGIYSYLPLALRSLKKIETIIREELNRCGCQEVLMPAVQPGELWEESGRWEYYGPELLRFKDRKNADYCLGPTHEEVITDMVRRNLTSYKQLPLNLYQIQTKFRDEIRPRFGLMRGREFIMKDAYSFDVNEEEAKKSYKLMYDAYNAIFKRCGLGFRAVDAATGAIGGDMSHEFQVLAETGEDEILSCGSCSYSANIEKAISGIAGKVAARPDHSGLGQIAEVHTPGMKTVDEVASFLSLDNSMLIKTMIYQVDDKVIAVLVRGNSEANEAKIQAFLGANLVAPADEETVKRITGAEVGFAGPVRLKEKIEIIADKQIYSDTGYACGANKTDYHLTGIDPVRDIAADKTGDFTFALEGDPCPHCEGILNKFRGIEVGQVFYLGTKYSSPMKCVFIDNEGKEQTAVMGCYGIGVSRTMAAAIEQNHDDMGIIWPASIAPFEVIVMPIQGGNDLVEKTAENIYASLGKSKVDVILDDRNIRAGVKFNDADLVGYPVQVICGSRLVEQGMVEIKIRKTGEKSETKIEEAVQVIKEMLLSL
jgi:prolyl-tRNA synthetase